MPSTLSINSNIADVFKKKIPQFPKTHWNIFFAKFRATDQAQRYHRTSQKTSMPGDILGYRKPLVSQQYHRNRSALDSILGPEVLDSLQTNLAFRFLRTPSR